MNSQTATRRRAGRALLLDELQVYVFEGRADALAAACLRWMAAERPFRNFVETNRDKIRKKARIARDEEERRDLLAELAVAEALLRDGRMTVVYEAYAAQKQRGPDFTITFHASRRFNVEVTRQRRAAESGPRATTSDRLASTICAKLGQMPPSSANVLWLVLDDVGYARGDAAAAMKQLKGLAERKDEAFFTRRGFSDARDFLHFAARLSAVVVDEFSHEGELRSLDRWLNPEARHALGAGIEAILAEALGPSVTMEKRSG